MHWLLFGYMFLFIHRPFEIWPALGDLRIERVYMLGTLAAWAFYPGKRWLPNFQHLGYFSFWSAILCCWALSSWSDAGQPVVEDYFKIVVFYLLLVTVVHDEETLQKTVLALVVIMGIYLSHSLKEYLGGRHTYRMGIARMIGVDSTAGDPNSFGATIVFVLPFVAALWNSGIGGRLGKLALTGYVGLSTLCILLTGSRSSLLGLGLWTLILVLGSRRKWLVLSLVALLAPVGFLALPPSLQNRFETIINPEVGPANAKESGEGRIVGLFTGIELFQSNPLSGVGPGAWRPATRSKLESHNLYGQLLGETGILGTGAFLLVLAGFWGNLRQIRRIRAAYPEWGGDMIFQIASAVGIAVILLLFMGNFGHNMLRYGWLWFGGFLIIARSAAEERLRLVELNESHEEEAFWDDEEWEEPEVCHVANPGY